MGKLFKVIRNNLDKKTYFNNFTNIEQITDKRAPVNLNVSQSMNLRKQLDSLYFDTAYSNLKIFLNEYLMIKLKRAAIVTTPILLGTISYFFIKEPTKTVTKEYPVYEVVSNCYDENEVEVVNEGKSVLVSLGLIEKGGELIDSDYSLISDANETFAITFYDNNTKYTTYMKKNHQNEYEATDYDKEEITGEEFVPVQGEIDPRAQAIIDRYIETNKHQGVLTGINNIDELIKNGLENNINDIAVKETTYHYLEDEKVTIKYFRLGMLFIVIITDLIGITFEIYLLTNGNKIRSITVDEENLVYQDGSEPIRLIYTNLNLKNSFYQAEYNRLLKINKLLEYYDCNKSILNKYEKKLLKIDDTKNR